MFHMRQAMIGLAIVLGVAIHSHADSVEFFLDYGDFDGTFDIWVKVIGTDSDGLAAFDVKIEPNGLQTIQHESPFMQFSFETSGPVGFSSGLAVVDSTLLVNAQDYLGASPLIGGYGQAWGSFDREGYTTHPSLPQRSLEWLDALHIASGTFDVAQRPPSLFDGYALVFSDIDNRQVIEPDDVDIHGNVLVPLPFSYPSWWPPAPEPSSIALLALGGVAILRRRRA